MKLTEPILAALIGLIVVGVGATLLGVVTYQWQSELLRANDLEQQAAYYAERFGLCKTITDQKEIVLKWGVYGE
jgi:hypothetical protein